MRQTRSLKTIAFSVLIAALPLGRCLAQTGKAPNLAVPDWHLAVRLNAITLGIKNPAAGQYPMDSVPRSALAGLPPEEASKDSEPLSIVTIPPQCTGAKRCPLLVQLSGQGQQSYVMTDWMGPVANKYGFILLAIAQSDAKMNLASTLTTVLQRFAIDTSNIAIAGRCMTGVPAVHYGTANLNIFSRIISVSGGQLPVEEMDPTNKTAAFLIDEGIYEGCCAFEAAQTLRQAGHPVTVSAGWRDHSHQVEDYDFVGHWLMKSWTSHASATPQAPTVKPLSVLTLDALNKLSAFWTSFAQEPDSIRLTARRRYLHEVVVPIRQEQSVVWMTDMPAFAVRYPTVAAAFKRAGLTAQEHDAYRVALLSAVIGRGAESARSAIDTGDATSALQKDIAFLAAHPDAMKTLEEAGKVNLSGNDLLKMVTKNLWADPDETDHMYGKQGMGHTP